MAWGGPEEQWQEHEAGNLNAKDWHNEALKILECTMEEYWENGQRNSESQSSHSLPPTTSSSTVADTLESEFDHHRHLLIHHNNHTDGGGWKAELHRYRDDLPIDITKETDIVEWWAAHVKIYPTLAHISKDVCAIPATSVPCEHLFSAGVEIATDCRSHLGADQFEKLQIMKHAWCSSVKDLATENSMHVDEVQMNEFVEMCMRDKELLDHFR
jgi:hypothetical protein